MEMNPATEQTGDFGTSRWQTLRSSYSDGQGVRKGWRGLIRGDTRAGGRLLPSQYGLPAVGAGGRRYWTARLS